jgi:hypothetical protein
MPKLLDRAALKAGTFTSTPSLDRALNPDWFPN